MNDESFKYFTLDWLVTVHPEKPLSGHLGLSLGKEGEKFIYSCSQIDSMTKSRSLLHDTKARINFHLRSRNFVAAFFGHMDAIPSS